MHYKSEHELHWLNNTFGGAHLTGNVMLVGFSRSENGEF
jgi:hypothetical protein